MYRDRYGTSPTAAKRGGFRFNEIQSPLRKNILMKFSWVNCSDSIPTAE